MRPWLHAIVSLIDVMAWISILGGNFLKSNKRTDMNKYPGTKISHILAVHPQIYDLWTFSYYFDVSLSKWISCLEIFEKRIIVLPLIRVSWEKKWRKIIKISSITIRELRVPRWQNEFSHSFWPFRHSVMDFCLHKPTK